MRNSTIKLTVAALLVALPLLGLARLAEAKGISNNASLAGSAAFARAKGNARFRFDPQAPPSTMTVTVENGTPGTTADVRLDGASIGSLTFNRFGNGTSTISGVAAPVAGKLVAAYTADGVLIASGTFQ